MKQIPLTQGKIALVDDGDYEWLTQWKWRYSKSGYAIRSIWPECKTILMHRAIMNTPEGFEVDHIDHDGCNNQRSNLRNCSHAENTKNHLKHKNNKSGYNGVFWDKKNERWETRIRVDGRRIHLGRFESLEDAAKAFDKAALKYYGEFARLNLIEADYGNEAEKLA